VQQAACSQVRGAGLGLGRWTNFQCLTWRLCAPVCPAHSAPPPHPPFLCSPTDRLIASGWSVRSVRVMLQVVGMVGPAGCLLLAVSPLVGASPTAASTVSTRALMEARACLCSSLSRLLVFACATSWLLLAIPSLRKHGRECPRGASLALCSAHSIKACPSARLCATPGLHAP